jgi:hypothetical protein
MTEEPFGFPVAKRTTAEKLKAIAPSQDDRRPTQLDRVDAAADALGFVAREPTRTALPRRRKEIGPTVAINMRVPENVAATFIAFCEQQRMSYWEGVAELMKRCGIE